jgi:hypothetical protein
MIETIEHRVVRLEVKVDDHDEELNELRTTSKALSSALHGIEKTLLHIKWLAMGGVIVLFGKELGVEKVLTIILGVL